MTVRRKNKVVHARQCDKRRCAGTHCDAEPLRALTSQEAMTSENTTPVLEQESRAMLLTLPRTFKATTVQEGG